MGDLLRESVGVVGQYHDCRLSKSELIEIIRKRQGACNAK